MFDAFIDRLWETRKSFWDLLISDIPLHKFYTRSAVMVLFFIFAYILSRVLIRHKLMAGELASEHERFNITLRSIGDGVIVTDIKGNIVMMNNVAVELTGYEEKEAKGEPLHRIFYIINERTREPVENPVDRVIEKGEIIGLANDTALISKDGTEWIIADSGAPILDKDGSIIGVVLVFRDITEKKRAEDALRKSEDLHRNVVEQVFNGIYIMTEDGFEFVNKQYIEITGYSFEELTSPDFDYNVLLTDESRKIVEKKFKNRESGEIFPAQYSFKLKHKSGKLLDVEVNTVFIGEAGNVRVLGTIRDITDRKLAEDALQESEKRFKDISYSMADWIWEVDKNGVYTYSSGKVKQILGYEPEELIGKTPFDLMPEDEAAQTGEIFKRIASEKKPIVDLLNWNLTKEGKKVCLLTNSVPLLDENGNLMGYRGVDKDITERKEAEDAVRESEEKYRTLFEESRDAICITSRKGEFLDVNQAMLDLFRFTREQIKRMSVEELYVEPEDRRKFQEEIENSGSVFDYEVNLRKKDGAEMICLLTSTIQKDPGGKVLGYQSIIRDITDRRRAEQENLFLSSVTRQVSDAIIITDLDFNVTHINRATQKLYGYDLEELMGKKPFILNAEPVAREIQEEIHESVSNGEIWMGTHLNRRKDGSTFHCSTRISPIHNERGEIYSHIVNQRDITERVKAEIDLQESEEKFRLTAEHVPIHLGAIDMSGKFTIWNKFSEKMFGYKTKEAIGELTIEAIQGSEGDMEEAIRVTTETDIYDKEIDLRRKDGTLFPAHLVVVPKKTLEGEITGFYCIAEDITERSRAEEERHQLEAQMQHAQKLESLGVLAGGIAHDFNNLLMGILGNASLAMMDLAPESPVMSRVQHIETTAMRAADLTNQMLAYSGKGAFVVRPLDLTKLVEEMHHLLDTVISKKASLNYNFSPQFPSIEGDATQLRQVIMNLITNASDSLEDKSGVITVTTGSMEVDRSYFLDTYLDENLDEGIYTYLEVSDTGCGMDKETKSKIFDPFFTTKFKGRGLGLAAVLGIVRGHSGAIKVYSEPGQGSTFKVLFPSTRQLELTYGPEEIKKEPVSSSEGTILVVDDEETVRTVAKSILEKFGYSVVTAKDGLEGIDVFKEHRDKILLVLLDMTMPKLSGEEAFREMRRIRQNVRVILSSGYNEQDATNRFTGKGLAGFIQKPYRPNDLLEKIKEILS